jgi:agmatinase
MDFGNVERGDLSKLVIDIISHEKVPIIIGGDHSITTLALAAIGKILGRLSILYFDAHPDFVSSTKNYYGSVMTDSADFIDFEKSMLIGTRAAEPEEIENAAKAGMQIITPLDLTELGLVNVARRFAAADKKYISIDLDCVDPAFAPGVSVPSPGGLSSIDLLYLVKKAISTGVIAMDIVELSPNFDLNNVTANLAARILSESIASMD